MIILSVLNFIVLLALLILDRRNSNNNVFSPGALFIYFALLPAFSNLYFSLFPDSFEKIVFQVVHPRFRDYYFVNMALFLTILLNLITFFGIQYGVRKKNKFFDFFLNKVFFSSVTEKFTEKEILKFGIRIYILGFLVYLIFLFQMGGLSSIWNELHLRSVKNAGLGYFQTFYMVAIQLGGLILLWYFRNKGRFLSFFIILIGTIFILGSIGARGPVALFLLSLLFMSHYLFKRVKNLLNFKTVLLVLILPFFIVILLQFRSNSFSYYMENQEELVKNSIEDLESGFIGRIGRLERDIVILKYFEENDFWWGKSYLGLFYAPIPRGFLSEKPPNDTGRYLRGIALGNKVEPPLPVAQLPNSSWPEGNWAGYMNFGILGFFILVWVSGVFFGRIFNYINSRRFPVFPTIIFCTIAVGGAPNFSPYGLVTLLTSFFYFFILFRFFGLLKLVRF